MKEHLQKFLCYNLSRSDTNGNDKEQSRRRNQYHHRAIPQKKKDLQTIFFNFSYNVSYQCLFENHKKG